MKKNLAIAVFTLMVFFIPAQITFEPGYLVSEKGDTIRGDVKYNAKKTNEIYTKLAFRDSRGIQKNYKPEKVKAYGFKGRNFVKNDYGSEIYYYEVLASGYITLYKLVFEAIFKNEVVNDNEYFLSKADGKKFVDFKPSKFKKMMSDWMEDNLEFINTYEDEKALNEARAIEIINQYNAWKSSK